MRNTRTIAAVLMLATTFCADRANVAAPQDARLQPDQAARGIASRLTASFRRVVPAPTLHQARQEGRDVDHWRPVNSQDQAIARVVEEPPFHYRLPPPVLPA